MSGESLWMELVLEFHNGVSWGKMRTMSVTDCKVMSHRQRRDYLETLGSP